MANSLMTVVSGLAVLFCCCLVLYKFLENLHDSARGMSIEESMAKRDAAAKAKKTRRIAMDGAVESNATEARRLPVGQAPKAEAAACPVAATARKTAATAPPPPRRETLFYPRIVYQCPYATGRLMIQADDGYAEKIDFAGEKRLLENARRKTG